MMYHILLVLVFVYESSAIPKPERKEMPLDEMESLILEQFLIRADRALLDAAGAIKIRDFDRVPYWMDNHRRPAFYDLVLDGKSEEEKHLCYMKNIIFYRFLRIVNRSCIIGEGDRKLVDFYVKYLHNPPSKDASEREIKYYKENWEPVYLSYHSGDPERVEDAIAYFKYHLEFVLSFYSCGEISSLSMLINSY